MGKKFAIFMFTITAILLLYCTYELYLAFGTNELSWKDITSPLSLLISAALFLNNALRPTNLG
ncbi:MULTISPECIES: hypothetical protein [Sphingobacterium]|uniref:hypothetical protein n=1 Tax=Sphingobacterium TaxID=28453 RepID=UPI001629CBEC|nr:MULTISPECIES: hypothetical protein [Sphingobacterium]